MFSEKEDEAPICLLLESGSVTFISRAGISMKRRTIKPYAKSFNLQNRILQESLRISKNVDLYEKEMND